MATKREIGPEDLELSDDGVRIASLMFGMAFYADVSLSKIGPATLALFERFQALCGKGTLNFYITDTMNKHKPVTDRALGMLATWLRPGAPARDAVAITYQASEVFNEAPRWSFMVNGAEVPGGTLTDEASVIRLGFPPEYGQERAKEMTALFAELCGVAPFRSARAGFTFVCTHYGDWEQEATEHAWAKSMRHPGADITDIVNEVLTVGPEAIMGVDWLTFIDSRFVKQLGGAESLEKQAKKSKIDVRRSSKGLLFRAGDSPKLGDVNRGDDLPTYKALDRILKPLMLPAFDRARSLSLDHDEEDRTLEWLKRHER